MIWVMPTCCAHAMLSDCFSRSSLMLKCELSAFMPWSASIFFTCAPSASEAKSA